MSVSDLPTVYTGLNAVALFLLIRGYLCIKRGNRETHKKYMISATIVSGLFLVLYLVYHYQVGSVAYQHQNWTRPVYFAVLIPHVILAAVMSPFILWLLSLAIRQKFEIHRKLARFVWPVWVFVSASGIFVYLMLYVYDR